MPFIGKIIHVMGYSCGFRIVWAWNPLALKCQSFEVG